MKSIDALTRLTQIRFDIDGRYLICLLHRCVMQIEIEQEEDGRWLTEIPDLPGVMVYGATRDEAVARVKALALRVLADRLEHGAARETAALLL